MTSKDIMVAARGLVLCAVLLLSCVPLKAGILAESLDSIDGGRGFVCQRGGEYFASPTPGNDCVEAKDYRTARSIANERNAEARSNRNWSTLLASFVGICLLAYLVLAFSKRFLLRAAGVAGKAVVQADSVAHRAARTAGSATGKAQDFGTSLAEAFRKGKSDAQGSRER